MCHPHGRPCAPIAIAETQPSRRTALRLLRRLWARFPHIEDSLTLAEASQRDGIMLAPGAIFRPHLERSPWMRFNVTICEDTRVQRWLQRQTASKAA
jgi:hypothetical protein